MLVPYLYGPEFTSQIARDALLLIMSASNKNEFIAEHIIQKVFLFLMGIWDILSFIYFLYTLG